MKIKLRVFNFSFFYSVSINLVFITAEAYKNAGVDAIKDDKNYFWVRMKDVQDGSGIKL